MGNRSIVSSLFNIACRINNLPLDHTHQLTQSVQYSLKCPCSGRPTGRPKRRGRHEKKLKKLCRTKTLLFSLAQCYQYLNSHA
uniref:Uncharacterized protein n=1 Tax=Knipowitschia caucasica TaxID=637954 RepID=A0AAV2L338_KNICA